MKHRKNKGLAGVCAVAACGESGRGGLVTRLTAQHTHVANQCVAGYERWCGVRHGIALSVLPVGVTLQKENAGTTERVLGSAATALLRWSMLGREICVT